MTPPNRPLVTVSLVTYNGMSWLPACMASVRSQQLADFELLVLDNASTDGSLEWLRQQANEEPRMRLTESNQNLGYAAAHNRHLDSAQGAFLLLLNQDVELDGAFLREAVDAFEGRPALAAVQGRLRQLSADGTRMETLDSTGLQMRRDRRVVSRGQGEADGPPHRLAGPVWGADGPAPVYRRIALLDAHLPRTGGGWEVLDEDFFMYKEDVDLAWRLRRLGWSAWYAPSALAWHARGAGVGAARSLFEIARANQAIPRWIKSLSWRNQRLMQVKNETTGAFLRDLPWIMRREALSFAEMVVADPLRLAALPALVRALPAALRKRRYLGGSVAVPNRVAATRAAPD
ncbi:MAG: glycosyltransferase family 2 protein [Candidatus Limnocylindrales bacterium]